MAALSPEELERLGLSPIPTSPPLNTDGRLTAAERQAIDDAKATGTFGGWAQDILRSAGSGVEQGVAGLPGAGGDTFDLLNALVGAGEKFAGVPEEQRDTRYQDVAADRLLPNSEDVRDALTDSDPYRPKSATGKAAEVVGSLVAGGGLRRMFRDLVFPAVGITAGGAVGEAVGGAEGRMVGEIAGGVGAPVTSELAKRSAIRPVSPQRQAQIHAMQREGIDLTGGQATGNKQLQYLETGPYESKPASVADRQAREFNRAAWRRAGFDFDTADPQTVDSAYNALGDEYEGLIQQANGVTMDPVLEQDLMQIGTDRERMLAGPAERIVSEYFNRIVESAHQNGGVIPPDVYAELRSAIARDLRNPSATPEIKQVLRGYQEAMYDSMGRNGQPQIADQWRDLNNRYRNYKVIEKAMSGAGEGTNIEGHISPAKLRSAAEQGDKSGFARGHGDFTDLAKAGSMLNPLPQSGTAARTAPFWGLGGLGGAATFAMNGQPLPALATAVGAVAPFFASPLVTARPVRTSIVNRAAGAPPGLFSPMQLIPIAGNALDDGVSPMPVEEEPAPEQPQTQLQPIEVDPNIPQPVPGTVPRPPQQQAMLDLSRMVGQQLGIGRA